MISYGYSHIPINCFVILQSLKDYEFDYKNIYFKNVIKSLFDPSITKYSAKRVFRYFLSLLNEHNISQSLINDILIEIKTIENDMVRHK